MKSIFIIISLLLALSVWSQKKDSLITHVIWKNTGKKCLVSELKPCIIITYDGAKIKNAQILQLYPHTIYYMKDGSLHDIAIYRIKILYVGLDKFFVMHFDPENGPYIESNYY